MLPKNLKILIRQTSKGVQEFGQIVGISADNLYNYQSGKRTPDYDVLIQIVQKYKQAKGKRINLDWLITGEGEMFIIEDNSILSRIKEGDVEADAKGYLKLK